MADDTRTQHPYHMYDAIMAQPEAFAEIVGRIRPLSEQVVARLRQSERIYLVGIGTSSHAAQVGYHLFRQAGAVALAQALHSFDFALYGPALNARDSVIVVSHRGSKRYSLASIKRAKESGCFTVLITGEGTPSTMQYADVTFTTTAQDKSSAHTVSYTGAIAVLACLAEALGQRNAAPEVALEGIPAVLRACLQTDARMAELARLHTGHRRIWVVGGGPSGITAPEIALKIKETSYLQAEGMATEVMLHGPFQCTEAEDLFIVIAPAGAAQERTLELAAVVRARGAPAIVITDSSPSGTLGEGMAECVVPAVTEPFTALTCLIPLQLFTYHLALARGTNPDGFRLEDPAFAQAMKLVQL